jgi:hypothetical protein
MPGGDQRDATARLTLSFDRRHDTPAEKGQQDRILYPMIDIVLSHVTRPSRNGRNASREAVAQSRRLMIWD